VRVKENERFLSKAFRRKFGGKNAYVILSDPKQVACHIVKRPVTF